MLAFDHVRSMYDVALKPRLLRSLLNDYIPDQNNPFRNPLELPHVVSTIKTHRLLSESVPAESADRKLIESWRLTVDAWVHRLLELVSSNMPDKCWAGICLLGVTCQECSSDRFLASYSVWFNKLLSNIMPPRECHFVKVASCVSISDLFTRLVGFPNIKKDATSHAAKVIQPILKLLTEDSSDAVWEGAVFLLCTTITFFPSSVQRHYDAAEAVVVSKIMSGKCSFNLLKKFAHCLALLPKSRGDEDSWSLMMHKVLLTVNVLLNDALQGVEDESKRNEVMMLLVPPGKDPPPPLGGQTLAETSEQATKRPELLMSSVSSLMLCCCTLLTSSYPVQVRVPIRPLLALTWRMLMVDGSLPQAMYPFMTSMQQESVCSELPVLHLYSLELLTAIIKGVRSQLLPHAANIVRLLTEYFGRCALPELRIKVYSITRILVISMGVGMAVHIAQEVINNAFADLESVGYGGSETYSTSCSNISSEAVPLPGQRKRKHVSRSGSLEEQIDSVHLEGKKAKSLTPISVNIAALEALEALLTVGGSLKSESWQTKVDLLLITVAANACKKGWAKEEENVFFPGEPTSTWAGLQLAALQALLASLLSHARVRPPYLVQGLELFRRGMQETGTKLAQFCAHALLALEVLIHPRTLPLTDFTAAIDNRLSQGYSSHQKQNTSFSGGAPEKDLADAESDDDHLCESWFGDGDEMEVPVTDPAKNTSMGKSTSVAFKDPLVDDDRAIDVSSGTKVPEKSKRGEVAAHAFETVGGSGDEVMTEVLQFQETTKQSENMLGESRVAAAAVTYAQSGGVGLRTFVSDPMDGDMVPGKDVMVTKANDFATEGEKPYPKLSQKDVLSTKGDEIRTLAGEKSHSTTVFSSDRSKGSVFVLDNEPSMDDFPDIVDGDPDSD